MTDEKSLAAELKAGRLRKVYYLFGREPYLVRVYSDRIVTAAVGKEPFDMNLVHLSGTPDLTTLSEHIEGLPVFSDKKAIVINDLDPEKTDADTLNALIEMLTALPEEVVLVIEITGISADAKKAKTKKLIAAVEKNGMAVELQPLTPSKIAELMVKKAARAGVTIDRADAQYLAERTLCNMTLISQESDKLISCAGKDGRIDRALIDSLVSRQLETSIYDLASAISAGKAKESFSLLDELITENTEPVVIMSALSGAFVDFYRAKLAKSAGKSADGAVADFSYPRNRAWVLGKTMNTISRVEMSYIKEAMAILSKADRMLKSTTVSPRVIIEQTVAELLRGRTS